MDGKFWWRAPLSSLGLVVNLGHGRRQCPVSEGRMPRTMQIIDSNGVFSMKVQFCACSRATGVAADQYIQLIRAGWFPATMRVPQTAVTFRCLDDFGHKSNQGKLTGYDYYNSLMHRTDNTELDPPNVSVI